MACECIITSTFVVSIWPSQRIRVLGLTCQFCFYNCLTPQLRWLTFATAPLASTMCSLLVLVSRCCQYMTSLSHCSQSTPSGQALAPFYAYLLFKHAFSPFINRLTQSLKPTTLNSPPRYSNFPSNCKRSLAMSTWSYSVTLTTAMFKTQGASDLIAPSHASFPSHAPSILPCLVTCTL